jgi:hypothetical protein
MRSARTFGAHLMHNFQYIQSQPCETPMSPLPPKADIAECHRHVRFVPKADIAQRLVHPHHHAGRLDDGVSRDLLCRVTDTPGQRNVRFWHKADIPTRSINVRFRGQSRHRMKVASMSACDPKQTWNLPGDD